MRRAAFLLVVLVLLAPPAAALSREVVIDALAQQSSPPRFLAPGVVNLTLRHLSPPAAAGGNVSVHAPSGRVAGNASVSDAMEARFENLTLDEHGGWNVFAGDSPLIGFRVGVSTPGFGALACAVAALAVTVRRRRA